MIFFSSYGLFLIGLLMLICGSELVISNSKRIATKFNISKLVIGITLVAFGTSFPEFIVSVLSSLKDKGDIAISNVIGSNIANIGLVLGSIAIMNPFQITLDKKLSYILYFI